MLTESKQPPPPTGRRPRSKRTTLVDMGLMLVGVLVARLLYDLLKKLHTDGRLLPGLSPLQFAGVVIGAVGVVALLAYLFSRWLGSRRSSPPV